MTRAALLIALVACLLSACGGGGDEPTAPDTGTPTNPCTPPPDGSRPLCVL